MALGAADPELYRLADQYDGVAGPLPANAAPAPAPTGGGLASFDVDAAAQNLASVGQPPPAAPAAPPVPATAPAAPTAPPGEAPPVVTVPGVAPDVLAKEAPKPPPLTGDPTTDAENNIKWQRDLADHYGAREQEIAKRAQSENAKRAEQEAAIARQALAEREQMRTRQLAERQAAQDKITQAVDGRASAQKDLEGANWADQHTGRALVATIFGAIGQGFMNAALIQSGHAPTAVNEGSQTIDRLIQQDYDKKKQRIAAMSESLLEARHGYGELVDNQRAAMNDLDADTAAKWKLVQKEAEVRLRQQGASDEDIKANAIVRDARMKQAQAEGQILDRENQRRLQAEHNKATEALAKAHLDISERTAAATEALGRANLGERRSEFNERRVEHAEDRAAKLDEKKAKAEEKKAADDSKLEVRDGAGVVRGYASSPRVVKPTQDRLVQFDDAIESLEQLKAYLNEHDIAGHIPAGDIFNRAALAVAATTTANSSDHTTHMETGTLKNWGVVSMNAIDRTLEHVRTRQEKFLKQLRPVGGEAAPEAAPAAPGKLDDATVARLRAVKDDKNAPPERRAQALDLLKGAGLAP